MFRLDDSGSAPRRFPAGARFCLIGLLAIASLPVPAHDLWIEPSSHRVEPGDPVLLVLRIAEPGKAPETVGFDRRSIVRFDVLGPEGSHRVAGVDGGQVAGVVRPERPGRHVVAYVSSPAWIELPAAEFADYLREEGLEWVLEERRELGESDFPARELFSRSLKALIHVGPGTSVDEPVGLPLELTLELAAAAEGRGTMTRRPTSVRLLWDGMPLPQALVRARRAEGGAEVLTARTGEDGRASFELGPGRWIVSTVTMERSDDPRAEWKSTWSSLTFEIAEPAPSGRPAPR